MTVIDNQLLLIISHAEDDLKKELQDKLGRDRMQNMQTANFFLVDTIINQPKMTTVLITEEPSNMQCIEKNYTSVDLDF